MQRSRIPTTGAAPRRGSVLYRFLIVSEAVAETLPPPPTRPCTERTRSWCLFLWTGPIPSTCPGHRRCTRRTRRCRWWRYASPPPRYRKKNWWRLASAGQSGSWSWLHHLLCLRCPLALRRARRTEEEKEAVFRGCPGSRSSVEHLGASGFAGGRGGHFAATRGLVLQGRGVGEEPRVRRRGQRSCPCRVGCSHRGAVVVRVGVPRHRAQDNHTRRRDVDRGGPEVAKAGGAAPRGSAFRLA